jgi:hypothetical protein
MISFSANPIFPWPVVAIAALVVIALTVWAYLPRVKASPGFKSKLALGLRLAAVLVCFFAMARPSVLFLEKKKQKSTVVVLADRSSSMSITDEVRGQSRWSLVRKRLEETRRTAKNMKDKLDFQFYTFDSALKDLNFDDDKPPEGRRTELGSMLLEAVKRRAGSRIATVIVYSDGASNSGIPPLTAAERLKSEQIPVVTVGFGSETAGASSRDIAVKTIEAGPTVFVKNELKVRGVISARGFANQDLEVEMYVDDGIKPVATAKVRAEEGKEIVAVDGLKYVPETTGDKLITLKVKPRDGELVRSNNEISTYVSVLSGGIGVLYLQGSRFSWEAKYTTRTLDSAPDIQTELKEIRAPVGTEGVDPLPDTDFAPGRCDVYILGDLAADRLTPSQQRLLATAVERGAGLIMLGGRSSFGPGGWAGTEVSRVLPVEIHPGDGQNEPEGGLKVVPNAASMQSYVLQVGPTRADTARIWAELPPLSGANRFSKAKPLAQVLAQTPDREPLMVAQEVGKGRVLVFGGETWVWARKNEETRAAHRKFWRQAILWVTHKENKGDNRVYLSLDRRRIAIGQKIELTVKARNEKDEPLRDVKYDTKITYLGKDAKVEPVELYNGDDGARGTYFAGGKPGEYRIDVTGTREGKELGSDSARFLVYEDDRELENPAADLALLRQIASTTGGKFLAPETLEKHLKSLEKDTITEYRAPTERRLWDNWPFLLVFVTLFTLEWVLRKTLGWV